MDVSLIMFRDDGEHRPFAVTKPVTTVGRREDCDLRIAVGDVSRKHCKLYHDKAGTRIEDLGSSNGTFVNGARVKESVLQAGDVLQIGPVRFMVQVAGEPPAEELEDRLRAFEMPPPGGASAKRSDAGKPGARTAGARKPDAKKSDGDGAVNVDGEIDELSILNDSANDSALGGEIDLSGESKH